MENIIVLTEWHGNSWGWGGAFLVVILLGIALAFVFGCYIVFLLTDKESYTFSLDCKCCISVFTLGSSE